MESQSVCASFVVPVRQLWSHVLRQGPNDAVVGVLLHDVSTPASDSTGHKDGGVLRHRNAHGEVGHPAREINIGMNVLVPEHDALHGITQFEKWHG